MRHVAVLICLLVPAALHAQDIDSQQWVLVTTPDAVSVADVSLGDIDVAQDGHPSNHGRPTIQMQVPLRIGLVFDESGSGRSFPPHDAWLERVLSWAGDTLQRHKGDAFLIGFNDHVAASTAVTADVSQLRLALNKMQPRGGSAVRDAVVHGSEKFSSEHLGSQPLARLLVVVCDGHDNASYNEERDAIESLERFGVRMYAIGLPQTGGKSGGKKLFEQLASETGGQAFFPTDQKGLDRALATIERVVTNSFLIGFVPEVQDGKAHRLSVKLSKTSINLAYMPVFYSPGAR